MTCYSPLQGYRSKITTDTGKRRIVFNLKDGFIDLKVTVPCGQCIGCRLERSRVWAVRCMHEASLHEENCFITLTYNDENLPYGNSLIKSDFQKFMKRLRKRFSDKNIRYYYCGEYGTQFGRPHYHAIIFGLDFKDKVLWQIRNENRLYRSAVLEDLWPFGFASIGSVTFQSAAYVARYIMKKVTGKDADEHYLWCDEKTGEVFKRIPEFTDMSRRPGIAKDWFDKFYKDVYRDDAVIVNGVKTRPPRFYDTQFEYLYPNEMKKIKADRKHNAKKYKDNNSQERLDVRKIVKESKLKLLRRTLE